jgi:acyl-coenzyme A thioesterase PaaI-like protein
VSPLALHEVQVALSKLPAIDQHGELVEVIREGELQIRLPFRPEFMGLDVWKDSGARVYSGPTVLGFTDTAMYACIVGSLGADALGIIQSMTTNFLRPAKEADLVAKVRILRRGKRSIYLEAFVYSDGDAEPISHTTATATVR